MAHYLIQASYTPQGWNALIKNPHNRLEALRPVVSRLGGTLDNGWLALGESDLLLLCDLPDTVSAAALSMALSSGGALTKVKTTPLIGVEDGLEAMRKASATEYAPPSSEFPYFGA